MLTEDAIRDATLIFAESSAGNNAIDVQRRIDALDVYWRESRGKPYANRLRFYVDSWKAVLLLNAGRPRAALRAANRASFAPASPYAKTNLARWQVMTLENLNQLDAAIKCAVRALRICLREGDLKAAKLFESYIERKSPSVGILREAGETEK